MAPGLPLVRKRGRENDSAPSSETFAKCIKTASTPEAAEALREQGTARLDAIKGEKPVQQMIDILSNHLDNVKRASVTGDVWAGKPLANSFDKYHEDLAAKAAKIVGEKSTNMTLDFALSNKSELLRGYTSNGNLLDKKTESAMDKLFNAWLAENNMISKGGVIYEGTKDTAAKDHIKQDNEGNPVRADAKLLREKINDGSFEQYVQKKNKDAHITIKDQTDVTYPDQAKDAGPSAGGAH